MAMKNNKHAYLIMAHGSWRQLEQLLSLLDDDRNDIFLHVDSKAGDIDMSYFQRFIQHSNLFFVKRRSVTWGGDSQIQLEMDMIESAVHKHQYDYLHLLSGVDFPIKSKEYIFRFFEANKGKEFLMIDRLRDNESAIVRVNYHYLFQNQIGRTYKGWRYVVQKAIIKAERLLHYSRKSKELKDKLHKGPNWFSITGLFAQYVISKKQWIRKQFQYTLCADEVFLQTVIYDSPFKDKIYINNNLEYTNLRATDWQRGNPYVWQNEDWDYLSKSPYLFARKFDTAKDTYIYEQIQKLY